MSHENRIPGEWMNKRNVTGCVVVSRTRTIFTDNTGVARFSAETCFAHSFAFASVARHRTPSAARASHAPKARRRPRTLRRIFGKSLSGEMSRRQWLGIEWVDSWEV
jgi:hypothetical protein